MTIEVRDNPDAARYEALSDGEVVGVAFYRAEPHWVVFTHTEVSEDAEGKGVASSLIRSALDDMRRQAKKIVPQCPFVAAFIKRHPEYADLVAAGQRA